MAIARRPRRSWPARILRAAGWAYVVFVFGSILWVFAYRFVNPPITFTQLGDYLAGRRIEQQWMSLDRMDRDAVRAVIAGEDSKYCEHGGFDIRAIEEAMRRNARGGSVLRGGSTISQQTAKNAFLWQGGGWFRKGLEAWFTVLIERLWDKRRIMEVYLNIAETGIGTYGVNAGAQRYFGHDASNLSAEEAARIAAVLPLPKRREAVAPTGFTRRYGTMIAARMRVVAASRLDACLYGGRAAPMDRPERPAPRPASPPAAVGPQPQTRPEPLPGEELETPQPQPPAANPAPEENPPPPDVNGM